jgi:hypothetical protein
LRVGCSRAYVPATQLATPALSAFVDLKVTVGLRVLGRSRAPGTLDGGLHAPGLRVVADTLLARKARFGHICARRRAPYRSSPMEKTQVDPPVSQTGLPIILVPPREFES